VTTLIGSEAEVAYDCGPSRRSSVLVEPVENLDAAGIAAVFKALSSPVRLRLIAVIQARPFGEACVCELVDVAGVAQSTVSHHLAALVTSGLVRRERRGTWVWYSLVPGRLEAVRALLECPGLLAD
jgi:ArsR family transcriptional regulator